MRSTFASLLAVPVAIGLSSTHAGAQGVPAVRLEKPDATFAEPLSAVRGLRELTDGRVIVTDMLESNIRVLDFPSGRTREIGHQGQGPGEYGMPGVLFAVGGDTTWMVDMANRRLMVILSNGTISDTDIPLGREDVAPVFPKAADRSGRIYYDLAGIIAPGIQTAAAGVSPVLRWNPQTGVTDTVGQMHFPPQRVAPMGAGEMRVTIGGGMKPYQGRDGWDVTPDGRVGIARYDDYHVEWFAADGAKAIGPAIPYDPVKIGAAEKDAWADRMTQGMMVMVENGKRRTMRPPRPDVDKLAWPAAMPPFVSGGVHASPDGELWVERSRSAKEDHRTFDVFEGGGNRVRQVVLPPGRSLVGFGNGVLYAVYQDADDLEWLERYRKP